MAKNNQIKKFVNGEIADADEVNDALESAGNEGGSIPYDPTSHQRETLGNEHLGSVNYPWGDLFVNEDASLKEVVTSSPSVNASILFKHLRKLVYAKDVYTTTPDSWVGHGGQALRVRLAEDGVEPATTSNVQKFLSSGTFTAPADITTVYITMIGGGGGGGGGVGAGGGGGSGAFKINHRFVVTPGANYTVTIGAAGAGGASGSDGSVGGTTSFDSVSVVGGGAGIANSGNGGAGGGSFNGLGFDASASVSTAETDGGGQTFRGGNGAAGNEGASGAGGGGGGSPFGIGATGPFTGNAGNNAAANTGAGGSGGGNGTVAGGNGGSGLVIVMY